MMIVIQISLMLFVWAKAAGVVGAYVVDTSETSLRMIDSRTGMVAHTLFLEEAADAVVEGILWKDMTPGNETEILNYRTFVNGEQVYQGFILLPEDPAELPASIKAGPVYAPKGGRTIIEVQFWVGDTMDSVSIYIQAFKKWIVSVPLALMCGFGLLREFHILYTLLIGLFVGACMVTGSFIEGFKSIITRYLIDAASNEHHIYIYTLTLCAAGLVAMIRRSGGISAVAQRVSRFSNSVRFGQIVVLAGGVVLFFDPYASIIFASEFFSPFFRFLPVSLEKYALLIHATGVPVSALNPLSTWVSFSISLIQSQLDKLVAMGYEDLTISEDGWTVFLRSIKYQFYPIFLLFLVGALSLSRRDLGPMLVAERERWLLITAGETPRWTLREKIARPDEDTPRRVRNMLVPTIMWIASVWTAFALVSDPDEEDNMMNFTASLIFCTIGVAAFTQIFYLVQRKPAASIEDRGSEEMQASVEDDFADKENTGMDGSRDLSTDFILKNLASDEALSMTQDGRVRRSNTEATTDETQSRGPYVSLKDGAQCVFKGAATVIPALVTVTLAWATTEMLLDLGVDRLFADLINRGDLKIEMYPTIGFLVAFLVAFSTGSFAAAQTIVLPLLCVPMYIETDGKEDMFYALIGAILSGSVLGDHASPISTSTILSTFMIECDLKSHIVTQTPYIVVAAFISLIAGHVPSGFDHFPYFVSYVIGFLVLLAFVYFLCQDVLHKYGTYDYITEKLFSNKEDLRDLKIRVCTVNADEAAAKDAEVLQDTDSASQTPSSDAEDSRVQQNRENARVQEEIELEIEDDSDESDEDESTTNSSYVSDRNESRVSRSRFRNYAAGLTRARSRSGSLNRRSRARGVDSRYAVPESQGSFHTDPANEMDDDGGVVHESGRNTKRNKSPFRKHQKRSARGVRSSQEAAAHASLQRAIEETNSSDAYTSGPDDYTTDGDTKSNATGMRTRVLKWLGQNIEDDDDEESSTVCLETQRHGRGQKKSDKYSRGKPYYRR